MSSKATRSIPIPYVLGFYLTAPQMRIIAHSWLAPEILAECKTDRDYQCELVDYCGAKSHKWTFLPDSKNETGEECYLWVIHVIPSWDGKNPKYPMPVKHWDQVQHGFGFDDLRVCCMRWPQRLSPPMWMMSTMYENIEIAAKNRREQEENEPTAIEATQKAA